MEALYNADARRLDKLISDHLLPDEEFSRRVSRAIDTICEFLRENCFRDKPLPRARVLKVVKGGSSGKGTALRGGSDADLVVFLSIFNTYKDQERNRGEIIQEIQKRLEEFQNKPQKNIDVIFEAPKRSNPHALSFKLCSYDRKDSIDFDVLPAFDALGQRTGTKPPPQVYIDLINSRCQGGEFSPCFTELQRDFIIERPTKLKSLIRLLKHWYKEYVHPYKAQLQKGESLPPKYALELLAVYAWEKGSRKTDFDMAEGFRTVLWLLQQYEQLCIFWTKYYDLQNETLRQYLMGQLRKPRPVILDPADPTGFLGEGSRWDLLAREAGRCSRQKCCTNYSVAHWDVPLLTEEIHSLNITGRNEESITIFLRNDTGRTRRYLVMPSDKVDDFKVRVQQQENIQAEQFWLTYDGKSLENGRKLSDYNIALHSTIYLNLRLRGGWIGPAGLLSFSQCFSDF
ncbi:UNVERIFIED_CONTAM: hypothetical protein K2H54_027963 [Gekko kuhli]